MSDSPSDELRIPQLAYEPDVRSAAFGLKDIDVQYQLIKPYALTDRVPEKIVIQYNVARNLYLYAYNVYRFYMVAHHHALVTLEFAIKEFVGEAKLEAYRKEQNFSRGLRLCMAYIREQKIVTNSDFSVWQRRNRTHAEEQYMMDKIAEMEAKGLKSIPLDFDEIDPEQFDIEWDYLEVLCENLPSQRNEQAHGSASLYNQVLITFDIVSTIINKLYSATQ
jgi:hypothetical protein